jgi:hypothetical protein
MRTLFFLLLIYFTFRYLSRLMRRAVSKPQSSPGQVSGNVQDTIVACPSCGTYNPTRHAYLVGGKFYCNAACYNDRLKSKS